MKKTVVFLTAVLTFSLSTTNYAGENDDPIYNQNVRDTPNFNKNYYDDQYSLNKSSQRHSADDYESNIGDDPKYNQNLKNSPNFNDGYHDRMYDLNQSSQEDD